MHCFHSIFEKFVLLHKVNIVFVLLLLMLICSYKFSFSVFFNLVICRLNVLVRI